MRFSVFVALVVATFVASCVGFANAENAVQVDKQVEDSETEVVNNDNKVVRLRGGRKLADQWNAENEERGILDRTKFLASNFKSKVGSKLPGQKNTFSQAEIDAKTKEIYLKAMRNPGAWPKIKKALKVTFGVTVAATIIAAVIAMVNLYA